MPTAAQTVPYANPEKAQPKPKVAGKFHQGDRVFAHDIDVLDRWKGQILRDFNLCATHKIHHDVTWYTAKASVTLVACADHHLYGTPLIADCVSYMMSWNWSPING